MNKFKFTPEELKEWDDKNILIGEIYSNVRKEYFRDVGIPMVGLMIVLPILVYLIF